jgi:cold shock protein
VATGTVKWFSGQKGYGFIQPDTGGKDVFVHISAVERAGLSGLQDGAKITYDVVPKGIGGKSEGDVREGDRRRPRRRGFHHSVTFTIMSERPDDELKLLARAFDRAWDRYYRPSRIGAISESVARPALAKHLIALARKGVFR